MRKTTCTYWSRGFHMATFLLPIKSEYAQHHAWYGPTMYMSLIEHNLFEEIMCTCIKRLEFTTKICMKENNIDSIHAGFVADLYQINIQTVKTMIVILMIAKNVYFDWNINWLFLWRRVHFIYFGVPGYNFREILYCFFWRSIYADTVCSISSGSLLFAKVTIYGVSVAGLCTSTYVWFYPIHCLLVPSADNKVFLGSELDSDCLALWWYSLKHL